MCFISFFFFCRCLSAYDVSIRGHCFRTSNLVKVKPLKSSWKNKMKLKSGSENVKKLQTEIREKMAAEKAVWEDLIILVFISLNWM